VLLAPALYKVDSFSPTLPKKLSGVLINHSEIITRTIAIEIIKRG
jgi:hypothetical protein